jgi:hypothetical protein
MLTGMCYVLSSSTSSRAATTTTTTTTSSSSSQADARDASTTLAVLQHVCSFLARMGAGPAVQQHLLQHCAALLSSHQPGNAADSLRDHDSLTGHGLVPLALAKPWQRRQQQQQQQQPLHPTPGQAQQQAASMIPVLQTPQQQQQKAMSMQQAVAARPSAHMLAITSSSRQRQAPACACVTAARFRSPA